MREHFHTIYSQHTQQYDRLVAREDTHNNILKTLQSLCTIQGQDVVEWGAGTGRITRLLAPLAQRIDAFDAAPEMLKVAREHNRSLGHTHVRFTVASHDAIPLKNNVADLAIEGWSFGHLAEGLSATEGAQAVQRALNEMERIVRPGGTKILIETQGTGVTTPSVSSRYLRDLYDFFIKQGFQYTWCRTDYRFTSIEEAHQLISFFFGPENIRTLDTKNLTLPECTGFWYQVSPSLEAS